MGNKSSQSKGSAGQSNAQVRAKSSVASLENVRVEDKPAELGSDISIDIPFTCSLGGGNGWPSHVTVVLYHQAMGILVVGTESGTLFAYGDGFQFMKADAAPTDITNIVEFSADKIFVAFADNSVAVLSIPTLALLARLEGDWLAEGCGDVTYIYANFVLSQKYVFVGTSEGYLRVLDVEENEVTSIRECDYVVTLANVGVDSKMAVSSLQLCPKDEKFLAISYDDPANMSGCTIIYDLSKKKVHRSYKSSGVTSLSWNHVGDVLYAGTRSGDILALGLDKNSSIVVWNVKSEIVEDEEVEGKISSVRKMCWMGPQKPNDVGCLFVLLGSFGEDTDHLKSVIVALTPNLLSNSVELERILSIPPIVGVEVVGFRLVSTLDRMDSNSERSGVPGLLLLGQTESGDGEETVRELSVLQCPDSLVTEWSMELGLLPEPRPAVEVLPGRKPITFKLLQHLQDDEDQESGSRFMRMRTQTHTAEVSLTEEINKMNPKTDDKRGRRRSTRDFFSDINVAILQMESLTEQDDTWALTLATAEEDKTIGLDMDIVFVGHADGSIIVWATSLPPEHTDLCGSGNTWIPLTAIKSGTREIACIEVCERSGLVAVGDDAGNVSVWQYPESGSSGFKRLSTSLLDSKVDCLSFSLNGQFLAAGTVDGTLYASKGDYGLVKVASLDHIGASGGVLSTLIAPYWAGSSFTFAIYVIFKSGHYGVVDALTHMLLSYCSSGSNPIDLNEENEYSDNDSEASGSYSVDKVTYACILCEKFEVVQDIPEVSSAISNVEGVSVSNDEDQDSVPASSATDSTPETKKGFGLFKKSGNTPPPSSSAVPPLNKNPSANMSTAVFPEGSPRYLVYIRGRYLVTCDLQKFALPSTSDKRVSAFSTPQPNAISMKCISDDEGDAPIIAAQDISIVEDAARFWSQPMFCLATIDASGTYKILSFPSGNVISKSPSLPNVFCEDYFVRCSTILPNSNAYLTTSNYMVFSSTPENNAYPQTRPVPCRAVPGHCAPPSSQMLHVTIGTQDAASHLKTKTEKKDKRRASVMPFAKSGPVDFDKLFSKSLDVRRKEELFGGSCIEEEEEEEEVISKASVKGAGSKTSETKKVLDETRQAFEERGERLDRLNKMVNDLGENSKLYKKNSAAHKEKMRKKAERWGFF